MKHPNSQALSDFLDGEISGRELEGLEAHMAECPSCNALLRELAEVQRQARSLPDRLPGRDLWPDISRAIRLGGGGDPQVIALHPPQAPARDPRRGFRISYSQAAAAGVVLALLSGVIGATLSGRVAAPEGVPVVAATPWVELVSAASPRTGSIAEEVAGLEELLGRHQDRLDPETSRLLEKNLGIIDRAIGESLRALGSDPGNAFLEAHLNRSVVAKADFLREAAAFVVPVG